MACSSLMMVMSKELRGGGGRGKVGAGKMRLVSIGTEGNRDVVFSRGEREYEE